MNRISLDQANRIVAGAFRKGEQLASKPLSIAVLDPGGNLIALARSDNTSNISAQIAIGKAGGALALGVSSRIVGALAAKHPPFIEAIRPMCQHGVIPAPGAVIVVDEQGESIGVVGVTGDTADNDELCALAGIAAAELIPQG